MLAIIDTADLYYNSKGWRLKAFDECSAPRKPSVVDDLN